MSRILNESRESQKAKQELDKLSMAAKQKVDAKRDQLQKTEQRVKAGELSLDSDEGQKFQQEMQQFNVMIRQTEEELREIFMKSNTKVTEEAIRIIEGYAKQNDIDLILDKSGASRGPVVFGTSEFDITDSVIKLLR